MEAAWYSTVRYHPYMAEILLNLISHYSELAKERMELPLLWRSIPQSHHPTEPANTVASQSLMRHTHPSRHGTMQTTRGTISSEAHIACLLRSVQRPDGATSLSGTLRFEWCGAHYRDPRTPIQQRNDGSDALCKDNISEMHQDRNHKSAQRDSKPNAVSP